MYGTEHHETKQILIMMMAVLQCWHDVYVGWEGEGSSVDDAPGENSSMRI
jgi:hypothetical protein